MLYFSSKTSNFTKTLLYLCHGSFIGKLTFILFVKENLACLNAAEIAIFFTRFVIQIRYLARIQHITVLIPFILGDPWFGIIFLGILNLANQYLNLKPKLRTLEILIAGVQYVVRLIYTLNLYCETSKVSIWK